MSLAGGHGDIASRGNGAAQIVSRRRALLAEERRLAQLVEATSTNRRLHL
jgi:hypothetical protein